MRDYVEHYAKKAEPLRLCKTALLKGAPVAGTARRVYAGKAKLLDPTEAEKESYRQLQHALGEKRYLIHYNPTRRLFADIDSSKETGMGGMIYHIKEGVVQTGEYPAKKDVEPIMFLSRLLTSAEMRYWPTELDLAGLVWVLRKIRHLVETAKDATTFYTDHGAALGIAKQTALSISSTDKLNLRLIRASDYIQRFNIILKHKPGKQHIVSDALSRLPTDNKEEKLGQEGELDVLFTAALVKMDPDFLRKIREGYASDPIWRKISRVIESATEDGTKILFCRENNGLIYRLEGYSSGDHAFIPRRLCIPKVAIKDILDTAHDSSHGGFARYYERVSSSYFIKNLTGHLKDYLKNCPECQINQTRRHRPYGKLQPILSTPIPFHTITLDFVLALPASQAGLDYAAGLDCMMSVTDKFSKRTSIIPGKNT